MRGWLVPCPDSGAVSWSCEVFAGKPSREDIEVVRHPGKATSVGGKADPGEEVELLVSHKLSWVDMANIPLVHEAVRQTPAVNVVANHFAGERLDFVVVGSHARTSRGGTGLKIGSSSVAIASGGSMM